MADETRKPRRRRRGQRPAVQAPEPEATPAPAPVPTPPDRRGRGDSDRGLRDLVGAGPSQLGPTRAARGRDMNRPTAEDLAEAEQNVTLVRRNWKPEV